MQERPFAFRAVLLLASLGLLAAGAWVGYKEAMPFVSGGVLARERFDALVDGTLNPGPSLASQNLVLESCLDAILSVYGRMRPVDERGTLHERCLDIAAGIAAGNPTHSYAFLVAAFFSARIADFDGVNEYLRRSQSTGSNEQWIAEQRVALAEQVYDDLTAETIAAHENDLRLLAVSARGVRSIAQRYVSDAGFRERITSIVEQMAPNFQERFLNNVRAAARAVSP